MIFPCFVIGDSLAVGIGQSIKVCHVEAKIGINSKEFSIKFHQINEGTVVISLGSNPGPDDENYLLVIRNKIQGKVIWILPAARDRDLIEFIAREYGDKIIDVRLFGAGIDHIHPSSKGYKDISKQILKD